MMQEVPCHVENHGIELHLPETQQVIWALVIDAPSLDRIRLDKDRSRDLYYRIQATEVYHGP